MEVDGTLGQLGLIKTTLVYDSVRKRHAWETSIVPATLKGKMASA